MSVEYSNQDTTIQRATGKTTELLEKFESLPSTIAFTTDNNKTTNISFRRLKFLANRVLFFNSVPPPNDSTYSSIHSQSQPSTSLITYLKSCMDKVSEVISYKVIHSVLRRQKCKSLLQSTAEVTTTSSSSNNRIVAAAGSQKISTSTKCSFKNTEYFQMNHSHQVQKSDASSIKDKGKQIAKVNANQKSGNRKYSSVKGTQGEDKCLGLTDRNPRVQDTVHQFVHRRKEQSNVWERLVDTLPRSIAEYDYLTSTSDELLLLQPCQPKRTKTRSANKKRREESPIRLIEVEEEEVEEDLLTSTLYSSDPSQPQLLRGRNSSETQRQHQHHDASMSWGEGSASQFSPQTKMVGHIDHLPFYWVEEQIHDSRVSNDTSSSFSSEIRQQEAAAPPSVLDAPLACLPVATAPFLMVEAPQTKSTEDLTLQKATLQQEVELVQKRSPSFQDLSFSSEAQVEEEIVNECNCFEVDTDYKCAAILSSPRQTEPSREQEVKIFMTPLPHQLIQMTGATDSCCSTGVSVTDSKNVKNPFAVTAAPQVLLFSSPESSTKYINGQTFQQSTSMMVAQNDGMIEDSNFQMELCNEVQYTSQPSSLSLPQQNPFSWQQSQSQQMQPQYQYQQQQHQPFATNINTYQQQQQQQQIYPQQSFNNSSYNTLPPPQMSYFNTNTNAKSMFAACSNTSVTCGNSYDQQNQLQPQAIQQQEGICNLASRPQESKQHTQRTNEAKNRVQKMLTPNSTQARIH